MATPSCIHIARRLETEWRFCQPKQIIDSPSVLDSSRCTQNDYFDDWYS